MFYCHITKKLSEPYEKPIRVVIESREIQYKDYDGNVVGTGTQIVREVSMSKAGYELWQLQQLAKK